MSKNTLNITYLNRQISFLLLGWGLVSIVLGITLIFFKSEFLRGFAIQFLLWGVIDFVLGLIPIIRDKITKRKKLYKILFFNSFLDLIYITIAFILIFEIFYEGEKVIGHGFGVLFQAIFLLLFDTYFGFKVLKSKE
tara:strand:- start:1941 stop:2351 length:411 start_codon:yes stop_codon:yes gene_type:complete